MNHTMRSIFLVANLFCTITFLNSQTVKQTVRGTITDKISQQTIPGATVIILNTEPALGAAADANGNFKIANVPIGKYSIKVSYIGYKPTILQNISVNAGKELVLSLSIEEDVTQINTVEIVAKVEKNKAQNSMSMVSTRTFSVEETQKFAAALNDPARMATSYAGVVSAGGDGNNQISIRGNSPNGLLWRMEGVEIPNPNHFSAAGTSGGGISILSAQLLGNSDFSTGAFASEYGNALSGVFDLKLRKGNNEKREYTFQAGFLGIDASTEGYFKKGYQGSYLVNYRYSTLGLIKKIGVNIGDANTIFQDLSFNIYLPTKRAGNFSLFGFGGLSQQSLVGLKDSARWKIDLEKQYNNDYLANTGAVGITHTKLFSNQSYLKTALVYSGVQNKSDFSKFNNEYITLKLSNENFFQTKTTLSSVYTQKINARSNVRAGFILNALAYKLKKSDKADTNVFLERINVTGNTATAQGFFQWNYKIGEKLTTNVGMHYQQLFLNNSNSIEPRASLKYDISPKQNITLGYGMHSQLQPIGVYFAKDYASESANLQPNKNLGFSKAHHLVLGYDINVNDFSHIKTEVYYQALYNIPISSNVNSTFSILNAQGGFISEPLVNKGLGANYGVELTYERFLHNNLYYLLSASIYDSKYKAANGNWYNTLYNTNYSSTFTIGKEWTLSEKRKSRIIGVNLKSVFVGGTRYTSIDLPASIAAGEERLKKDKAFDIKNPDYFRLDLRASVKRNYKKLTTTFALDIQNATNRENVGGQYFDSQNFNVKYYNQAPLVPILSYKLEF
jgi:CarboxypepD_reg-like domain/TonB dependent receptor/TonB-dependent Receptor Plug Domain